MSDEIDPNQLVALDSVPAKESLSVAQARHMVREHMLLEALEALHEIGMNPDNKPAERTTALRTIVEFAEGAEGTEGRLIARLKPEVARRLARLGKDQTNGRQQATPNQPTNEGQVVSPTPEGQRLGSGSPDGNGDKP